MSRKSSNYDDFFQIEKNNRRYTVQRTDSSISNVKSKAEDSNCYALFLCIIKWLAAVCLCSVVLFCVVGSKISLLVLGQHLRNINRNGNSTTDELPAETSKQALLLMLLLVQMIPQAVSFIYASWTSLRRKSRPWPTKKGFILIILGGFLETTSLCYITMVMLTVVPITPDAIILLMCSLPIVSAMWQAIKSRSRWNTLAGKLDVIKFGSSVALAVIGIALLLYKIPDTSAQIGIVVALILVSIAWSPKMRKLQSEREASNGNGDGSISGMQRGTVQGPSVKKRNVRGKAAIVSSLWNLLLTPFITILFAKVYHNTVLDNVSGGFKAINTNNPSFVYFMFHVFTSFFGYHLGLLACSLCMQPIGYALPLTLATPIAVLMTLVPWFCETSLNPLPCGSEDLVYTLPAGALLCLAQFLTTTYYVWKSQGLIMAKAHHLLWIPSYNGVCLEQYLLLNKRNQASDEEHATQQKISDDVNIFICTTMYHEEDYEMEQLLQSIHDVDTHSKNSGRHYESHIFFDGCVRAEVLNSFVLQLASLVEKTLNVKLSDCTKMKTPYGMQLKWKLQEGMDFIIHLKDNAKVKNKKRWSQVMYMSYVLDYKEALLKVQDDQSFILTTDADVKFTHESVESLIDQIVEDPQTGAVCARTHPMGSGPVVWYQIFDYASGHWFQKVANHMLGSVLCSPGCFSLYRCQAVRDVLPTYATGVDHAFEFLTKDMGEDRWMCTLMIQRGWRLTYCAAAVDGTYCPETFDEFYKQRRRWTPSTLANLVLVIREWKTILEKNEHISFLFILYQTFLVCSSVIGPSTVILVIVGGMVYSGMNLDEITTVVLICLIVVAYALVCLFTSQNFQLKVSKILTFVFAVIMCIVVVGVALQISRELQDRRVEPTSIPNTTATPAPKSLEHHLPAGVSTLYLAGLSAIFVAAGLLHIKEFTCLLHAVWYLLCLPSGYLLLTVYSLCNITDRSWGTREGKSVSEGDDWYKTLWEWLKKLCACCRKQEESGQLKLASNQEATREGRNNDHTDKITNEGTTSSTTQGKRAMKTGDEEVLRSQAEKTLDGHLRKKGVCRANSVISLSERSTRVQTHVDVNLNYDRPTFTVYSADQIPKKNRVSASKLVRSKKATESNPTVESRVRSQNATLEASCEHSLQTKPIKKGHHLLMKESTAEDQDESLSRSYKKSPLENVDFSSSNGILSEHNEATWCNSTNNPCSGLQNKFPPQPEASCASDFSICSPSLNKSLDEESGNILHPQNSSASQLARHNAQQEDREESFPCKVSAKITSSTAIIEETDAAQQQRSDRQSILNSELSLRFDSTLQRLPLDENGRPLSTLKHEVSYSDLNLSVDKWLTDQGFKRYAPKFQKHGYDNTGLLFGMTDKDLEQIGIETRGHRQKLLREIKKIPRVEIEEGIPDNVKEWLEELGLGEYWPTFESSGYTEPCDLEDLKRMEKENVKGTFKIHKPGHFNRLISAIRKLQYPNQGQEKIRRTRRELDRLPLYYMDLDNQDDGIEYEFWEGLRQACLIPELSAFDQSAKLKEKLVELRNTTLVVFGVTNVLWMIIILTLVQHKDLKVLGVDVIGLGFLIIYGLIFVVQFLALLGHRFKTIVHVLARTPWKVANNRVYPSEPTSSQQMA